MIVRTLSFLRSQIGSYAPWVQVRGNQSAVTGVNTKSGVILKSVSTDIYENLALEDWIHDNVDLRSKNILFLWRNGPAVVIGRHQNPWQECNLPLLRQRGVPLARRRSGGGTVFHDLGNVNLTFFTCKKTYDRHKNLRIVTSALKGLRPGLDVQATERFDILLNGHYKISGTAAKLGRTSAYHHCTLLCSADRALLSASLKTVCPGITSNATPSVPSPVKNLLDEDPSLDCETIMSAVATQYNTEFGFSSPVTLVDPNDELSFPGIQKMTRDLETWEWTFGKTPKFSISAALQLGASDSPTQATANVNMEIKNGIIESCGVEVPNGWLPLDACREFGELLTGGRFCPSETAVLAAAVLRSTRQDEEAERRLHLLFQGVLSLM